MAQPATDRRRRARHYNRLPFARYLPAGNDDELPALRIAGALVFVYIDPSREECTLRVSVDLDEALPELCCLPDGTVPLEVTVQGEVVFSSTTQGDAG